MRLRVERAAGKAQSVEGRHRRTHDAQKPRVEIRGEAKFRVEVVDRDTQPAERSRAMMLKTIYAAQSMWPRLRLCDDARLLS